MMTPAHMCGLSSSCSTYCFISATKTAPRTRAHTPPRQLKGRGTGPGGAGERRGRGGAGAGRGRGGAGAGQGRGRGGAGAGQGRGRGGAGRGGAGAGQGRTYAASAQEHPHGGGDMHESGDEQHHRGQVEDRRHPQHQQVTHLLRAAASG